MTSSGPRAHQSAAGFDERLEILAEELELSIKWQRPCMVFVVYSSEYVRADVEVALENLLFDLGQKSVRLSVKRRDPNSPAPFFKEFKDPARSVYLIDGFHWGGGEECEAYSTACLQREYFVERQIRSVFWLTPSELKRLTRAVPDLWIYRHRVIEFVESAKPEQLAKQAVDSAWQGTGEYADDYDDTDARITMRESMLTELPKGEEAISIRANLLLTLGVLNWRRGDFEKAEEQLNEALEVATKVQDNWFEAECFNAVALIKSSTGRIDEAIEAYKQAILLAPNQIFVWNNLGNLCVRMGRNDEAMIAFQKALECNGRDPIALNGLAGVHFKLGYAEEAIAAYRKALHYTPSFAQPWCGLGDVYASTGRADEALKCYHKAIEQNKTYVTPWLRQGELFTKQERFRDAVKAYRRALGLDGRNSQAWMALGTIYMKSESFHEAAEAFSKALELDRGNGWGYSNLAYAFMQMGRHKEGVSLLLRSIELMEGAADKAVSWNRLADLYRALNDYDNAVAAYQMADQLRSGGGATQATADAEQRQEEVVESPASTQQVSLASAHPSPVTGASPAPLAEPGQPTVQVPDAEDAAIRPVRPAAGDAPAWIFERSKGMRKPQSSATVAPEPEAVPESSEAAVAETPNTQPDDAQREASLEMEPKRRHAEEAVRLTAEGNARFKAGALEEAVAAYNKAIQIDATYGVPHSNLALCYVTQGQFTEAILLYQKSVELLDSDRDKALSWNGLGNAYRCIGDYGNAVAAYQQAASLDPETGGIRDQADNFQPRAAQRSPKGWNDLGELLLKTGALDKAIEAFSKAIELQPSYGRAHFNLARAHSAGGRYAEAIPWYEKGIELLENDREKAEAWNGLGNAFRKLNDYEKAINAYQKAVVLADEGVDLLARTRFSLLSNVLAHQ